MIRRFEARGACSTITLTTSSRIETSRPSIALSVQFVAQFGGRISREQLPGDGELSQDEFGQPVELVAYRF